MSFPSAPQCCATCLIAAVANPAVPCSRRCQWAANGACAQCGRVKQHQQHDPSQQSASDMPFCSGSCASQAYHANWCVGCGVRQKAYGSHSCGVTEHCIHVAPAVNLGIVSRSQQQHAQHQHQPQQQQHLQALHAMMQMDMSPPMQNAPQDFVYANGAAMAGGFFDYANQLQQQDLLSSGPSMMMPYDAAMWQQPQQPYNPYGTSLAMMHHQRHLLQQQQQSGATSSAFGLPPAAPAATRINHRAATSRPQASAAAAAAPASFDVLGSQDKHRQALESLLRPHCRRVVGIVRLNGNAYDRKKYLAYRSFVESQISGFKEAKYGFGGEGNEQRRFTPVAGVQNCVAALANFIGSSSSSASAAAGKHSKGTSAPFTPCGYCDLCRVLSVGAIKLEALNTSSHYSLTSVEAAVAAAPDLTPCSSSDSSLTGTATNVLYSHEASEFDDVQEILQHRSVSVSSSTSSALSTSTPPPQQPAVSSSPHAPSCIKAVLVSRVVVGRPVVCSSVDEISLELPALRHSYVVANGNPKQDGIYVLGDDAVDACHLVLVEA